MSNEEALNIALSVGGMILGIVVSWAFFRANQQTDFNKLRDSLAKITEHVSILSQADMLWERMDLVNDLAGLRATVDSLNRTMLELSSTILKEFGRQQQEFTRSVQAEFENQTEKSSKVLEASIERELKDLIPRSWERAQIVARLGHLVKLAMYSMGQFQ
jgi:uncharacterized protein YoxC